MLKFFADDARKMIFEAFGDKAHQTLNQMLETGKHCGPVANVIANLAESLFGAEKSLAPMTADQSQCNRDTVRLLVKMLPGVESGAAANAIAQLSRYGIFCPRSFVHILITGFQLNSGNLSLITTTRSQIWSKCSRAKKTTQQQML